MGFNAGPPVITVARFGSSDEDGAIEVVFAQKRNTVQLATTWQADGGFPNGVSGIASARPRRQKYQVTFTRADGGGAPATKEVRVRGKQKSVIAIYYKIAP